MITGAIERALISGKALLKTHIHNVTEVSKIVVPTNNFIIITGVTVYPFTSAGGIDAKPAELDGHSTHVVEFSNSDSERQGFAYRNNPEIITLPGGDYYMKNSEPIHFDTYMVRSKDVFVQVGTIPGLYAANVVNVDFLNSLTQCPKGVAGYGDKRVLSDVETGGAFPFIYAPTGSPDSNTLPGFVIPVFWEALPDYKNPYCTLHGQGQPYNFNFFAPLVQVQYVQLVEQARKDFQ